MKIKKLTIKNMNSIYGTWEIDFQNEAFLNNPLFAITGKTGSGKSTILDAISFALYDRTDRIGSKRSAFASRGTTECMAELIFEVDGIEYCSHTTLKVKSSGPQKGTYYDAPKPNACWLQWQKDGEVQKVEGTNAKGAMLKQILGLDFNQFCQVILLAQGKFNAFLAESPSNRADILEKITGTAIYTKIGGKIAERSKAAAAKRQQILDKIATIKQFTDDELQQKEARQAEIVKEIEQIAEEIRKLEELLSINAKRGECETQLIQKRKEEMELAAEEETFTKDFPKLEAARIAAKVTPAYLEYKPVEEAQERDRQSLENVKTSLPIKRQEKENAQAANAKKEKALRDAEAQKAVREAFLLTIDQLDAALDQLSSSYDEKDITCQNLENEIQKRQESLKSLEEKLLQLSNNKKEAENYLKEHSKDSDLESKLSGWQEICTSIQKAAKLLKKNKKELKSLQDKLDALHKEADDAQKSVGKEQKALDEAKATLTQAKENLASILAGRTLDELKADVDEQNKTVALLRALNPHKCLETFKEGAPCPVCGSTHHPYRLLPPEELPSLEKAEQQLKKFEKRYKDATEAAEAVNNAELALKMAQHTLQTAIEKKQDLDKRLAQMQSDFDTKTQACHDEEQAFAESIATLKKDLAQYGFTWNGEASLPDDVQTRKTTYSEKKAFLDNSARQQAEFLQEKARLEGEQKTQKALLEKVQEELKSLQASIQQQKATRFEKYQDRKTADERSILEEAVSTARKENEAAVKNLATAENNVRNTEENAQSLASAMTARQPVLDSAWKTLEEMLQANGLTLVTYLANILPQDEFDKLVAKETSLKERRATITQTIATLEASLKQHIASLPEDFSEEDAQKRKTSLQNQTKALSEERGGIAEQLKTNEENKRNNESLLLELAEHEKDFVRWEQLDQWIGGINFRQMAQAYTFENLLVKANEQMQNMLGGRFRMCSHQDEDGLEIDVIDNQLGGDIRTSKNLSGGEQFVVSMALALGLSSMVGEKFKVDSLFLDEGFGTLDGNELDEAMNTLSQLRGDGKLVGIITHAERLQERISTRITLEKHGNGRSSLEGPGVRQLTDAVMHVSTKEKKRRK